MRPRTLGKVCGEAPTVMGAKSQTDANMVNRTKTLTEVLTRLRCSYTNTQKHVYTYAYTPTQLVGKCPKPSVTFNHETQAQPEREVGGGRGREGERERGRERERKGAREGEGESEGEREGERERRGGGERQGKRERGRQRDRERQRQKESRYSPHPTVIILLNGLEKSNCPPHPYIPHKM